MIDWLGYWRITNMWCYQILVTMCFAIAAFIFNLIGIGTSFSEYLYVKFVQVQVRLPSKFDYIVVGAGTAGCIVASRLAEHAESTVLLLEAGPVDSTLLDIPLSAPFGQLSVFDWKLKTIPQTQACLAMENHVCNWPMGKVVGGTSRFNYQMYVRGHKNDYDGWLRSGNIGWGYEDLLPYFLKNEKHLGRFVDDKIFHSNKGTMHVSDLPFTTSLAKVFIQAGEELGYKSRDLNAKEQTGFMETQANLCNGSRCSTDKVYIHKNPKPNLYLLSQAHAVKVLFKHNFEAFAVKYVQFNKELIAKARKAIILSAGTIGSAKLLMLSGIGPKKELLKYKIPVLHNLPVGENLQDHLSTGLDLVLLNSTIGIEPHNMLNPLILWQYLWQGKGPLTMPGCEAMAIVHTDESKENTSSPDLQLIALPGGLSSDMGTHVQKTFGIQSKIWQEYFAPLLGKSVVSILPVLLHPKSKGFVKISSSDPFAEPVINPLYLSDPMDEDVMVKGIELLKSLLNTTAMRSLGAKLNTRPFPGCENIEFDSQDYWKCYIHHLSFTSYHPVGTCRMGPEGDISSVVTPELQVKGTNHLYVIDASVMPSLPSGNINAAVMAIAEKGADILKYHKRLSEHSSHRFDFLFSYKKCQTYQFV